MKALILAGSDTGRRENLALALREIRKRFPVAAVSHPVRSRPWSGKGDDYLNAALIVETDLMPEGIVAALREIEAMAGRRRSPGAEGCPLDLDLMALEGFRGKAGRHILPRDELRRPYAMVPSAEIAPGLRIEESGPTLLETKGGKSAQDLGLLPLTEPAPEGFPS